MTVCASIFCKRLLAMKLLGKLLNSIGVLGCIFAVAMQVYLNFEQFGKWYSGYIVIHWSLIGLLGLFLFPIGYRLMEKSGKKERKEKGDKNNDDGESK